jgi:hypothetical protein
MPAIKTTSSNKRFSESLFLGDLATRTPSVMKGVDMSTPRGPQSLRRRSS